MKHHTAGEFDGLDIIMSRGVKFPDHPSYISQRHRKLLTNENYESKEARAALKAVKPSDRVLELGGGLGFMSALLMMRHKPAAYHLFEANPALIPYIHAVHRLNGIEGVVVQNALLGPENATAADFFVRGNFLASSMANDLGDAEGGVVRIEQVPVLSINDVMQKLRPSFLVCDIEGAESMILPKADLSSLRAVLIELHPQMVGQIGIQAVFDVMHAHGMTYFPRASNGKVVLFKKRW